MASNTENLNLLMKNPSTDGADTFNVDTMLNENWRKIDNNAGTVAQTLANILKPTTPPIIGLPPSTTPDGMFQALGNTGELHVWRKTVKNAEDVPAGYTLGDTLTHGNSFIVRQTTGTGYVDAVIQEASSISVSDNGVISASWGGTIALRYGNSVTFTPGRFVKISSINTKALSSFAVDDVVWVPSDGGIQMNFSNDYGYYIEFTKCQKVNAHGVIPAGTTTTYPVSTNPNAYQEGSNANTIIEYLGKLGDKARMQVVSYVGTGTYGDNNPTVIEFDIVPKVFFIGADQSSTAYGNVAVSDCGWVNSQSFPGSSAKPGRIRFNGKKISIISDSSSTGSYNTSGWKYIAIAIS